MNDQLYYVAVAEQKTGPFTVEEVRQQQLPVTTLVYKSDMLDWAPLSAFPELQTVSVPPIPSSVGVLSSSPYFLFDSFSKVLNVAALCGMGGAVAYFFDQIIDLGSPGFLLFSISQFIFYWGLSQIGRFYQLKWVRRGSMYLMLANLIGYLPLFSGGFIESAANWMTAVLSAIGTIIAFVDLWALRNILNRRLVTAVVIGHIAEVFILTLLLTSQSVFQLLEATNVGLLAWLFYEVETLIAPAPPTEMALT